MKRHHLYFYIYLIYLALSLDAYDKTTVVYSNNGADELAKSYSDQFSEFCLYFNVTNNVLKITY